MNREHLIQQHITAIVKHAQAIEALQTLVDHTGRLETIMKTAEFLARHKIWRVIEKHADVWVKESAALNEAYEETKKRKLWAAFGLQWPEDVFDCAMAMQQSPLDLNLMTTSQLGRHGNAGSGKT